MAYNTKQARKGSFAARHGSTKPAIKPAFSDAPRLSVYESVTNHIVAAIERGAGDWRMPWHTKAGHAFSVQPVSISTGKRYRGMNTVILWATAQERGYDSALWGTFKSWKDRGASVNKGEKATQVVFWKSLDVATTNDAGETVIEKRLLARGYYVFNVAQVSGYEPKKTAEIADQPALPGNARIDHAERFFGALKFDIRHGGNQAYCSRATHHIQMPEFDQFDSPEDYYSTLAHECTHRSGHDDFLDRVFGKRHGDEDYAKEELVAELGAAFTCSHLAISNEPRPDHAAYIQSWLKVLKGDSRFIFSAASKAQAACDFLVKRAGDIVINADDESDIADTTPLEAPTAPEPVSATPTAPESVPLPTAPRKRRTKPVAVSPVAEPVAVVKQWERDPAFKPCKRSTRTGRKLRWRTYFGYHPADGLNYPPMTRQQLAGQAADYQRWLAKRDAESEMPLAAD